MGVATTRRPLVSIETYLLGSDVFISYSRLDAYDYAGRLANELGKRGLRCFLDQVGAPPGSIVQPPVLTAARRAMVFVVVASPQAVLSSRVQEEVEVFPSRLRPLIPIMFEATRIDPAAT